MAPEEAIAALLVTAGVGVLGASTGWSIRMGFLTDTPDTQVVIYTTGGKNPNPKYAIDYPSFQVRVRGEPVESGGYTGARQKIQDMKDTLLGCPAQNIGVDDDRLDGIIAIGDIVSMGRDERKRPSFVMNFSMFWEPTHKGNRL